MAKLDNSVTLEMCIKKLKFNKQHYGDKGLDMQIYFTAQLFNMSYDEILEAMNAYKG